MYPQLEICCFDLSSALVAQEAGADRIELCADASSGGTTASLGLIQLARKAIEVSLFPIIRPRGGDFVVSNDEFEIMKTDILQCKKQGCDGVVFGALTPDGVVDRRRCAELVELAYPMEVTFHKAFDCAADAFESLELIIQLGFQRILTSGQRVTAMEGACLIKDLVNAAKDRIVIMPGSGIRASNILELATLTGAVEFHSSARNSNTTSTTLHRLLPGQAAYQEINPEEIRSMSKLLISHFSLNHTLDKI